MNKTNRPTDEQLETVLANWLERGTVGSLGRWLCRAFSLCDTELSKARDSKALYLFEERYMQR